MNKSSFTLALSLAALLGGGLVLPTSASAHDSGKLQRVGHDRHAQYSQQDHHDRRDRRDQHAPYQQRDARHADNWYLLRHRESRPYGYHSQPPLYRMQGQHHPKHRHEYRDQRESHDHRDLRIYAPVRLEIGYEVVL